MGRLLLAHGTGGGDSLEQIALAVGVILLGVAFLSQGQLDRKISIGMVVLGVVLLVGSFTFLKALSGGGQSITVGEQTYPVSDLQDAVNGLCTAAEQAPEDFESAQALFLDRAHIPLHAIAQAISDEDRAQEAELLEAKNRVETDITSRAEGERLAEDLRALAEETRASLRVLSISAPTC